MVATPTSLSAAAKETLPRELNDVVVEIAVCVHKRAIYPESHPMLHGAVDVLLQHLTTILSTHATLSVGVANRRLVIEGINTDEEHLHLRELAERLHEHLLGAIRFHAGLTRPELDAFLTAIAGATSRGSEPLGQRPADELSRWPHVALYPIAFDRLELLDGGEGEMDGSSKAAQLWLALARAALAGGWSEGAAQDPTQVASSIEANAGDNAYDQVVIGCLVQLLEELQESGPAAAPGIKRRASQLIESLSDTGLSRLLAFGGTEGAGGAQRRELIRNAIDTLSAQAVVNIARVATQGDAGGAASRSLLRLLGKLSKMQTGGAFSSETDAMLRLSVRRLLEGWSLANPNPEAYEAWLAAAATAATPETTGTGRDRPEPERVVDLGIETDTFNPLVEAAFNRVIHRDGMSAAIDRLSAYAPSATRDTLLDAVLNDAALREQLTHERPDWGLIEHAVKRLRAAAVSPMVAALDYLGESDAEHVVNLLFTIGWDALPEIDAQFDTYSPRAIRHLVALFERLDAWPPHVDAHQLARHTDAGVRREAFRILLRDEATRDAALPIAVRDPDLRVLNLALQIALKGCPIETARAMIGRYADGSLTSELRVRIIRAAATTRAAAVLSWLVDIATTTRWFRSSRKLRKSSPEVVAAVGAIATHYAQVSDGRRIVSLGASSRAPELRRAATATAHASLE
jgi:hypothetical protein